MNISKDLVLRFNTLEIPEVTDIKMVESSLPKIKQTVTNQEIKVRVYDGRERKPTKGIFG